MATRKRWTAEEDQYLVKHYKNTYSSEIGKVLERTSLSVKKRAKVLGLTSDLRTDGRPWEEEEIAFLMENYQTLGLRKMMKKLGRSKHAIYNKADKLGLTSSLRKWTDWELQYMEKRYILQPVSVTAKRLQRTEAAVQHKASAMGINIYACEYCSAESVASCFQVSTSVVARWVKKYGLPAKVIGKNSLRYMIEPEKFWKWAETNQERIDWSKYVSNSLPPEPGWVSTAKQEYETMRTRRPYTSSEKSRILHLRRQGKSYREIAKSIGRTRGSVVCVYRKMTESNN